jgi:hypothetical protein
MSSFSSGSVNVTFTVDRESFSEQRDARVATQEIPGGNEFTVDLAGRQPHKISVKAILPNETSWGAMNSALGTTGSLQIDTLNTHDVVVMSVSRDAPYIDGQISASIAFLVTDD